jgi:hypothetical protein
MKKLIGVLVLGMVAAAVAVPGASLAATPKPPAVTVIAIKVTKGRPVGGIRRPSVKKGTVVRFVITTDRGKEVHLHGYDIERPVVKGKPVVIQFKAKLAGRFELEMHEPDTLLAQLTVKP